MSGLELPPEGQPAEIDPYEPSPFIPTPPHPPIPAPAPTPAPPVPAPEPAPLPPVTPEPGDPEAMPDLGMLSLLIVVFGLIALAAALADLFNWLFQKLLGPLWARAGSPRIDPTSLTQQLSNYLGKAETGIDQSIGLSFTKLANLTTRQGRLLVSTERSVYQAVQALARVGGKTSTLERGQASTAAQVAAANRLAARAETKTATEAHRAAQEEDLLRGQVTALTTHITTVIEPELEALRDKIPALEKGATDTWDELTSLGERLGIGALTAAAGVALGRLGGGWVNCESTKTVGSALCASDPDMWRRILKGLIPFLAAGDLCLILKLATEGAQSVPIQGALSLMVDGVDELLHCTKSERPTPLVLPPLALAPLSAAGVPGPASV